MILSYCIQSSIFFMLKSYDTNFVIIKFIRYMCVSKTAINLNYKLNILMGSNQSKVASSGGVLSNFSGKCRPIDYSCHELLHTWSPSCSEVRFRNLSGLNGDVYFIYNRYNVIDLTI